jgi:hypothetical protein
MYVGAVLVLKQDRNPDAAALAAHGLRELMEKLPRYLNVPHAATSGAYARLHELSERWRTFQAAQEGQRLKRRQDFDACAEALAEWFPERHTPRKQWGGRVIDRLDPGQSPLPRVIKDRQVELWNECHSSFEDAAHHGNAGREDVERSLQRFEDFLHSWLNPQTVEDQRRIEDIIREGEADA